MSRRELDLLCLGVRRIAANIAKCRRGPFRKAKMELLMAIGKIYGLATAAVLGASSLIGLASAAPTNALSAAPRQVTNNFRDIRWVCGPYHPYQCWWAPSPYYGRYARPYYGGYYAPRYYDSPWWAHGWSWGVIR
jgi:hypothetical protein